MTKKQETKEIGLSVGAYEESELEIIPSTTKREEYFNSMVASLREGKFFVLKAGYTPNSLYLLLRKIKEKTDLAVSYAKTKAKDGTVQFVIFVKKEEA